MDAMPEPSRVQPLRIDWRIAMACTVVLIAVFSTQNSAILGGAAAQQTFLQALGSHSLNWGTWLLLLPLVFAIGARGRAKGITDVRNVLLQILAGILVAVLHTVLVTTVRWSLGLTGRFGLWSMIQVMVSFSFAGSFLRYWLIAAAYHALESRREGRERDVREARLAASLAQAKLESLEQRLHPHFLFNTLNAITSLIRKDPPTAAVMVENLSDLLRAALDATPGREITLARELQLIEQYAAIQQARFSDRLRVSVNAAPDVLPAFVPPMILQPIVENAIRHGIAPREAPGAVAIEAARHDGMLRLTVRDDGVGFGRAPASSSGQGLGLGGTRERLGHLYGERFSLDIAPSTPTGTIVTIDLPFHTEARAIA
jgi:two-component system, LytTR family, sensor kinase